MTHAAAVRLPERTRSYLTPIFDSARWDGFVARPGDVIVCTPVKSGTTWTQMLCALLIHRAPISSGAPGAASGGRC